VPGSIALPARTRSILGREHELDLLGEMLAPGGPRLITLTGPAGVGKTRLAVEAAWNLATASGSRATFVDLAPLTEAELVVPSVAAALHVTGTIDQPMEERLIDRLRAEPTLLVLDNFEHLLDASPAVGDLLAASEGVRILATSREPLRISWEQEFPVPPLSLPDTRADWTATQLMQSPAVALFLEESICLWRSGPLVLIVGGPWPMAQIRAVTEEMNARIDG
jgi:predicted ATPase